MSWIHPGGCGRVAGASQTLQNNKTNSQNATQIYASFYLGQVEFAIPVEKITEVLNPPAHYAQIPLAPPYLKGIFTTLSGVVPVIDLRFIFQIDGEEPTGNTKIAIIEYGRHHIGVLFDRTGQVFKPIASEVSFFENNNTDESTKMFFSNQTHFLLTKTFCSEDYLTQRQKLL